MDDFMLNYPVHTLDGLELLPSEFILTEESLESIILDRGNALPETLPLLDFGDIKADVLQLLKENPYRVIFSDERLTAFAFDLLGKVRLVLPALETINYFKTNDFYTYRHILMVFCHSTLLAQDLVQDYKDQVQEAVAGPTHDIGKICVPLEILKKSDLLTRTDRDVLEHHTVAGYVLMSYYQQDMGGLAARVARDHHERLDGSGYPSGTHVADPLVQIVAASDVYDALISRRPYRPTAYDNRTALEEMTAMAERGQLGWEVVKALISHNRRSKPHYSACKVSDEKRGTPPADNLYGTIAREGDEHENEP
ncbi:MAG: HD domain-containing protein [Proteobacteria bacterium]|nr:HD domain-containing protein [Pseudomonadota bacterium]